MKKNILTILILITIQTTFSQDLVGYFEKYYQQGNLVRIQETIDLGLDPNTTRINKQSMADYVISNSKVETRVINILDILLKSGLNLKSPILFQKIVQNESRKIIDYLLLKKIDINSIEVDNQYALSTDYLEYLTEKNFRINEAIVPRRKFELKKIGFIKDLKSGNIDSATDALDTYMGNSRMTHVELFYALKTKDTTFIGEVLKKASENILLTTYTSLWNEKVYGEKPTDFTNTQYPLNWAMRTNSLNVVKYIIDKGAIPQEKSDDSRILPSIKRYVNDAYTVKWHENFNEGYFQQKRKYGNESKFNSYTVPNGSLLEEILMKNFIKKIKRSFGITAAENRYFFIELKFLKFGSEIESVYVRTNDTGNSEDLKEYILKDKNKSFFEKLFKRLKYNEVNYSYSHPSKVN